MLSYSQAVVTSLGVAAFPFSYLLTMYQFEVPCWDDYCMEKQYPASKGHAQLDISLFYLWLLAVAAGIVLTKRVRAVGDFMGKTLFASVWTGIVTMGEALFNASFVGILFVHCLIWGIDAYAADSDPMWGFVGVYEVRRPWYIATQISGRILDISLGLMLITITRHSFVNTLLGVPFNEAIKVHKNLGYLIFIAGLVHTAVYIVSASVDVGQSLVSHLFNVNWNDPNSPMGMMGGTGPIPVWGMGMYLTPLGFFCMVALVPPFLMSLPQVRRWNYGFFKWTHWLMIPVSALAWLHVPADFYFMTPGIIIYTIDLVVRFIAYKNPHTVTRVTTSDGGYLRVDVQINPNAPNASVAANVRGGHYFNLNFPSVSKHEWHPFSVAADTQSTPGQLTFLIEPTRLPSRWTSRASAALQSASSSDAPLPVALDGPFGHPAVPLRSNTHATAALILCAGSGLGPATAVAHDAARTGARVLLCWSTRGREGVSGVVVRDGLLAELAGEKRAGSVVRVHQTGGRVELADGVGAKKDAEIEAVSPVEGGADGVEWREGRIDFGAAAAEAAEMVTSVNAKGGSVLVFVCGPGGFTRDAAKAVSAFGRANAGSGVKFDVEAEGFFY